MSSEQYDPFRQLHGEQLSSVEFVQDYLQLRFDGPTINVMAPITITSAARSSRSGEEQFRNMLCKQISKRVRDVSVTSAHSLNIAFEDGSEVAVSLKHEEYDGPEAVYYHGFHDGDWGVI